MMDDEKIGFIERFGYGLGDFACNLVWASMGSFIMFYYTDVVGIGAAVIGTLMMAVRLLDGVLDISVGLLVDRTHSKDGKARPWIKWMAVPFGLSMIALFSVPQIAQSQQLMYISLTYVIVNVFYTAVNVPYGVLNSLITQDQYQRSVVNIFRNLLSTVGTVLVTVLTLPLVKAFGGQQTGWRKMAIVFGVAATALLLITFFTTKERVKPVAENADKNVPLGVGLKALVKNKYWLMIVAFMIITFISLLEAGGVTMYYQSYILHDASFVGKKSLFTAIPSILILMFVAALMVKRLGKRKTAMIGCAINAVGCALMFINLRDVTVILGASVVKGLGSALVGAVMFALLADTIEYGEWKNGVRTEGLIYSAGSFGTKVGSGIGTAMVGWILAIGHYQNGVAVQSASAINAMIVLFAVIPLILIIIDFIILYFFKLDNIYPQIVADLKERAAQ